MNERRNFLRIPLNVPIKFRRAGFIQGEKNLSKDLSVSGVRFLSQEFVPVNTTIKVELNTTDNSEPIQFMARIMWIRSYDDEVYEIGAEICEISKESADSLVKLF